MKRLLNMIFAGQVVRWTSALNRGADGSSPAFSLRSQASRRWPRNGQRGSAVLIVLILLSIMTVLLVSNAIALRRVQVELRLLDQHQQARYSKPPA
jgi:hypothetical protein